MRFAFAGSRLRNSRLCLIRVLSLLSVLYCAHPVLTDPAVRADDGHGLDSVRESCRPVELRCEYLRDPIGIDVTKPRLSWVIESGHRGRRQTAYQIIAASSAEILANDRGDLWDSGKLASDQSVLVEYAGKPLTSGAECFWKVRIWDEDDVASDWSSPARFTIGLLSADDWKGQWIGMASATDHDEPWFRKTFSLEQKPESAVAYVSSIGYHELYVNGRRVGDRVLNPSVSYLAKRALYVGYDLADYLMPGENVIAVWLAPGWSLFTSVNAQVDFQLGKRPLVLAQVDIRTTDGKSLSLATDDTWKCQLSNETHLGEWTYTNFGGDRIDATKDVPGWNNIGLDDSSWERAAVHSFRRTLSPDLVEPNRKCETIHPVSVTQKGPRKYLIDMGRFYAGWIEAKLKGTPGSTVVVSASYVNNLECQYNQRNEYVIGASGSGTFCNRFTYHGCRYVTIEGMDAPPLLTDIVGYRIGNDLNRAGSFDCSNRLLKRIYDADLNNCLNLITGGMPADCPHRERLGYGDSSLGMLDAMLLSFESGAWSTKWSQDWCDIQQEDGYVAHTAPTMDGGGAPWLSGSVMMVPWGVFQSYGDRRILETTYPSIQRWLAFLQTQCDADGLLTSFMRPGTAFPQWCFIGDWVTPHGSELSDSVEALYFNNCYYLVAVRTAAQIAGALGKESDAADYETLGESVASAINKRFFVPEKDVYLDTRQSRYVMALVSGVVPEDRKSAVHANLRREILVGQNGHLDVGDPVIYYMTRYLTEHDANDVVFTYMNQKTYPGYGFFIEQGLDTWPETWDAQGDPSMIHGCFAGISAWLIRGVLGIRPDPAVPGFKHFIIKPAVVGDLTWAKGECHSPYGRIGCDWALRDGTLNVKVDIPANSSATVYLPARNPAEAVFHLQSGRHELSIPFTQQPE